jgi:hypothetical protein
MSMTRQQLGLLLVFAGTLALAFSVRTRRAYGGEALNAVEAAKKRQPDLIEPTEATIVTWRFRVGLLLVAIGTLFQW